jgi:Antibiotic biosynthesis monooxygenase.
MIVCWRSVQVRASEQQRFLDWIAENGPLRREHGIVFELVLRRSPRQNPATAPRPEERNGDPDDLVVVTAWPDHDSFDAWIDTPERDRLTASPTHQRVEFQPLTRYDVIGGYTPARPEEVL